jgi:hypothetical protein
MLEKLDPISFATNLYFIVSNKKNVKLKRNAKERTP